MSAFSVPTPPALPRVLAIAGTDPTGGAGIQADIKAITAAGGFPYSVVTSLVAQNTTGVQEIFSPPVAFLKAQLASVIEDVEVDAIKIGMLGSAEITHAISEFLAGVTCPVILDPVMVASSGDRLLEPDAEEAVRDLARRATVITPNLPELATLLGRDPATTLAGALSQATALARQLEVHVLMKGGHLPGAQADNAVVSPDGSVHHILVARVDTTNTHGTGCSLSAALATRTAAGQAPHQAAEWATRWVWESINNADALQVGRGNGPIDHSHLSRRMARAGSSRPWVASTSTPTDARLSPAGPYTRKLWEIGAPYLTDIVRLPFVAQLSRGTLRQDDFLFYLEQDALYLQRYAQALHNLGGPWSVDAEATIADEQQMQRTWLREGISSPMSPVTQAYTDFLIASTLAQPHTVGVAAVLPCYWLYFEVGTRIAEHNHPDHPFHDWLATYAGDDFRESAAAAIERVEAALAADPSQLEAATRAFLVASHYEVDFFDQADRAWAIPEVS